MNKLGVFALACCLGTACGEGEPAVSGSGGAAGSATSGTATDVKVEPVAVEGPKGPIVIPGKITMPGEPPVALTKDQCGGVTDGGPVIDGCMTAEVHCGDVIVGHTRGGVKKIDTRFYEKNFCTPSTTHHDGGEERIYKLVVSEPQTRVIAYLDSPCANLDLAAFHENSGATCPNTDKDVTPCEMEIKKQARKHVDIRHNDPETYWLVVEGQSEADAGPFSLSIQCEKW